MSRRALEAAGIDRALVEAAVPRGPPRVGVAHDVLRLAEKFDDELIVDRAHQAAAQDHAAVGTKGRPHERRKAEAAEATEARAKAEALATTLRLQIEKAGLKGAGEALLIHAVVQAFDNVYGGDLSATHTYGKGSLREGAFADMIRSEGGRTTIDWDAFNATRPLGSPVRDADPEPSAPQPGRPYISCGSARASYGTANALDGGAPRSALEPYCPYSTRLCLLLAEGGVDFTMVKIDLTAVQGWYSAAFKPGDAPAMWGTPGGKSVSDGWVGGSEGCVEVNQ